MLQNTIVEREEELDMTLADGSPNPRHPDVSDFMEGHAPLFAAKSAAHERLMSGQDPVIEALGAKATPQALKVLHDAVPKPSDEI